MEIINFDRTDSNHLKYVKKLSKINNFYLLDIILSLHCSKVMEGRLAVVDKKVIGYLLYEVLDNNNLKYINLSFLLIDKRYRSKGYATQLSNAISNVICDYIEVSASPTVKSICFWIKQDYWFPSAIFVKPDVNHFTTMLIDYPDSYDVFVKPRITSRNTIQLIKKQKS